MDNVAHTLAGLALAETGLARRTRLGTAALAIGANLPDGDAFTYAFASGVDALVIRRGWTHGVLAMAVLPFALAGVLAVWARARPRADGAAPAADAKWLVILCAIGTWSHPLLDLLNTYGVRLLMPLSPRWFHGDALFIVDPWLVLALGTGAWLSRRAWRRGAANAGRAATAGVALAVTYIAAMAASSSVARTAVERQADAPALRTMVAPVAANPFRREVVRDLGARYETGEVWWTPAPRYVRTGDVATGADAPAAQLAARSPDGRKFLVWSRFPVFTAFPEGDSVRVRISDARYPGPAGSWATVEVVVPAP